METDTSRQSAATAPNLGPVCQLGYVVEDIDAAITAWQTQLSVGPWTVMRNITMSCQFRGQASEPNIDIALSYRGGVQIELIQQHNSQASPYTEFIQQGRYGLHHLAFLSADIAADVRRCEQAGLQLAADIRMPGPGAGRYVYFDSPVAGEQAYIELLEATPTMRLLITKGMADARDWSVQSPSVDLNLGPMLRLMRGFEKMLGKRLL